MKKLKLVIFILMLLLLSLIILSGCSETKEAGDVQKNSQKEVPETITDMAGRTVEISSKIEKVYCKSPVGTILMYTLAPDKLAGWNYEFTENERKYINEKYRELPVLGG